MLKSIRLVLFLSVLFFTSQVQSATVTWSGGGADENWSTPLNWSTRLLPAAGDTVVFNATSIKNCTLNSVVTVAAFSINAGYTGTFTASENFTVNGTFTLNSGIFDAGWSTLTVGSSFTKGVGGTFISGSGTVQLTGSTAATVSGSPMLNNFTVIKNAHVTVSGILTVANSLTLTDGFLDGGSVNVQGDISQAITFDGGTTTLLLNGIKDQTLTGTATLTSGALPLVNINKTAGLLTLAGTIRTGKNWTYVAGVVDAGISTVVFADTLTITGSHKLNNVVFNSNSTVAKTITLAVGTTLTTSGTLSLNNSLVGAMALNGGTLAAQGDIVVDNLLHSGTTSLIINGLNSQNVNLNNWTLPSLTLSNTSAPISFSAGSTVKTATLNVNGIAGQNVTLRSSLPGTAWNLNVSGPVSPIVNFVDVQDSNASFGKTVFARNSGNSGNNTNWVFAPIAVPDSYVINQSNAPLVVAASGVLSNDTASNGGVLTASKLTDPAHGILAFNSNGSFTYTPTANYVGTDSFTYKANNGQLDSDAATVNLQVTATPTIIWNNPADIVYGTALDATQLNATTSVAGTFVYTPDVGSVLNVGNTQVLSATFTPDDAVNYTAATASVSINVTPATPVISWNNAVIMAGTSLDATQLNATANVAGTFVYTPAAGTVLDVGTNQTLSVSFTPDDAVNYSVSTATVSITVYSATDRFWVGNFSGDWSDVSNWSFYSGGPSGSSVPTVGYTAHFDSNGSGDCSISADVSVLKIELESSYVGTVTLGNNFKFSTGSALVDSHFVLGTNSQLKLNESGTPLAGLGLDTTTFAPNTVEYTAAGNVSLAATPYSNLTLTPPSGFSVAGIFDGGPAEFEFDSAAIAVVDGYAYFGTYYDNPATLTRVRLSDFSHAGSIKLLTGETALSPSFVYQGFLYVGTRTNPGRIVKIRLSDFTRVGSITLNSGENQLWTASLDEANGIAYFGTRTTPGKIVKVDLNTFTRVDSIALNVAEGEVFSSCIDTQNGFVYIGTNSTPGSVVKIRTSDFTRVNSIGFQAGEDIVCSGIVDVQRGFAYFATHTDTSKIIQVRLSDFQRTNDLTLDAGEGFMKSALLDSAKGFAYFGSDTMPGKIVKVDLNNFTRVDGLSLGGDLGGLLYAVIDVAAGFAYYPLDHWTGKVAKINLNDAKSNWSHSAPLVVNGDLKIGSGTLSSNSQNITLSGNWSNAGTYVSGRNTVSLVGGNQSINGNNTFFNLAKNASTSSASTLAIESGKLLKVTGKLTAQGSPTAPLNLNASVIGAAFRFESDEYQFVHYASIKDVNASSGRSVYAFGCTDGGNNQNVIFSQAAQVTINTPTTSATNPAWVEGSNGPDVTGLSFSVNSGASFATKTINTENWFAAGGAGSNIVGSPMGITISATQATHIDVTATDGIANNTVGQDIVWTPTDLKGNIDSSTSLTIRKGDSLLLTDSEEGTALWIDTGAGGSPLNYGSSANDGITPAENFPCKFDTTGTYLITSTVTKADATTVKHYLKVKVLSVNLDGPIACEVGYQREKGVDIFGGGLTSGGVCDVVSTTDGRNDVVFSSNDPYLMDVSVKAPMNYGARLFLKAKKRGTPILLARLSGVNGPMLAMQEVDEFTLSKPFNKRVILTNDSRVALTQLVMKPYVSNIQYGFDMFAHTCTFTAGQTSIRVNSDVFEQVVDAATGEVNGVFKFEIEVPTGETSYCFNTENWQQSHHGLDVLDPEPSNGDIVVLTVTADPVGPVAIGTTVMFTATATISNPYGPPNGDKVTVTTSVAGSNSPRTGAVTGDALFKSMPPIWFGVGDIAGVDQLVGTAVTQDIDDGPPVSASAYVTVVKVAHIKRSDTGAFCEGTTIEVPAGTDLKLTAIPFPDVWPTGNPFWFGVGLSNTNTPGTPTTTVDTLKIGTKLAKTTCGDSASLVTVKVHPTIILSVVYEGGSSANSFVEKDTAKITATVTPSEFGGEFVWTGATSVSGENGVARFTATANAESQHPVHVAYTLNGTSTDAYAYIDVQALSVTLAATPNPASISTVTVDVPVALTTVLSPVDSTATYDWSYTAEKPADPLTPNDITLAPLDASNSTLRSNQGRVVTVKVISTLRNATATAYVPVTFNAYPTVEFDPVAAVYITENAKLVAKGTPAGGTYTYNCAASGLIFNQNTTVNATCTSNLAQTYLVTVTYTQGGATATATQEVTFYPPAVIIQTPPPHTMIVCAKANLAALGLPAGGTYTWASSLARTRFTNANGAFVTYSPGWCDSDTTISVTYTLHGLSAVATATTSTFFNTLSPLSDWNTIKSFREQNNCYNFACDIKTGTFAQPGYFSNIFPTFTVADYTAASVADGLKSGVDLDNLWDTSGLPEGHIVSLRLDLVSVRKDFHWWRLEHDGTWSDKPGENAAKNGTIITPLNYTTDGGYFWVGPGVHIK